MTDIGHAVDGAIKRKKAKGENLLIVTYLLINVFEDCAFWQLEALLYDTASNRY